MHTKNYIICVSETCYPLPAPELSEEIKIVTHSGVYYLFGIDRKIEVYDNMTIREIADLSNVSIATVSKIINHKDQSIKQETKDRVLQIIKEYNYIPFQEQLANRKSRSNLIGILLDARVEHTNFLPSMINEAQLQGYCAVVCRNQTPEDELKNAILLLSHQVDGIIWNRISYDNNQIEDLLLERQLPFCVVNYNGYESSKNDVTFDFARIGYLATKALLDVGHSKIALLLDQATFRGLNLSRGFNQCLIDNGFVTDLSSCIYMSGTNVAEDYNIDEYTGYICENDMIALLINSYLEKSNKHIPEEVSIISIAHKGERDSNLADISCYLLPYDELGRNSITYLVDEIEGRQFQLPSIDYILNGSNSIAKPYEGNKCKIAVLGMLNMDTFLHFEQFPEPGETVTINNRYYVPGGKGLNQSVAVRKLYGEPFLIGCVGRDYNGRRIYAYMNEQDIDVRQIVTISEKETGQAYIYVSEGGESSIVVYSGANDLLTVKDIEKHSDCIKKAAVCLLESELPISLLIYTARIATESGTKVILKPCSVNSLPDELLKYIDIIVPNEKEIGCLVPGIDGFQKQAGYLREKGVETVIVTLGNKGCYVDSSDLTGEYPPAEVESIDTTGASDAFLGTLAVCLAEGKSLDVSIQYANCAAGLSTTRIGVPNSLVDRVYLEAFYKECYITSLKNNHK